MRPIEFKPSVINRLNYYVYCLVDPRDNRIFYIGKGHGNRVFQQAACAMSSTDISLKLDTIRDIIRGNQDVRYYILRHNLTEEQAYIVESVLIDLLTFKDFNTDTVLTNIQAGHHQWDEGIKTVDEIIGLYDCQPLVPLGKDRLLAVKLNRTYSPKENAEDVYKRENMYEKARKYWKLNVNKAQSADYVLAVYEGVVRAVFKPQRWYEVKEPRLFSGTRYAFDGVEVFDSPYLNMDVSEYIKGQSPVRYINF